MSNERKIFLRNEEKRMRNKKVKRKAFVVKKTATLTLSYFLVLKLITKLQESKQCGAGTKTDI